MINQQRQRLPMVGATVLVIALAAGAAAAQNAQGPPDPRVVPVPAIRTAMGTLPGPGELPLRVEMPDPLVSNDGTRVTTTAQWRRRREEIKRVLEYYAIGQMPPAPGNVKGREVLSQLVLDGTVRYRLVHLTFGPRRQLELNVGIFTPVAGGPFPAVIMPGGTPPGAAPLPTLPHPPGQGRGVDALLPVDTTAAPPPAPPAANVAIDAEALAARNREVFRRGYAYVTFANGDCAEDTTLRNADGSWAFRTTRFYPAYPGYDWGILAGWAWGVSRIVDYLVTDPSIDRAKLIVSGVSRTGKSAMVAAAFDERLAMAAPGVTGGGGIGAYRFSGAGRGGKEGLIDMIKKYPNWFSPHLRDFWGQVDHLPFDQHWFLALVAPRPFIALEGTTDQVSLANAVKQSEIGARPVYALFGAADRLGVNYADHAHAFTPEDWTALLDFSDKHLRGMKVDRRFDDFPDDATLERKDGFEPLFDGRTLAGWHSIPLGSSPGAWRVRDGIVSYDPGDSWLTSDSTYTDFVLRLEYRTTGADSDSGIFLRSTPAGYPSFTGMELEIKGSDSGQMPGPRTTGSVYGAVAPLKSLNKAPGVWNQVEVTVNKRRLTAMWNGETVQDVDLDDPAYATAARGPLRERAASGHIGFQAHLTGAPVEFRNVRIKVLK